MVFSLSFPLSREEIRITWPSGFPLLSSSDLNSATNPLTLKRVDESKLTALHCSVSEETPEPGEVENFKVCTSS